MAAPAGRFVAFADHPHRGSKGLAPIFQYKIFHRDISVSNMQSIGVFQYQIFSPWGYFRANYSNYAASRGGVFQNEIFRQ
jgi:hypothetical protein